MRIYLRPISLEDGSLIVKWRNTPSVSAHCLNQKPITIESNEIFFHKNIETGNYLQFIVERIDGFRNITQMRIDSIGNILYHVLLFLFPDFLCFRPHGIRHHLH